MLTEHMRFVTHPAVLVMVQKPEFFKHLPYFSGLYKKLIHNRDMLFDFFNRQITQHQESIDFNSSNESTDFVEAYLREIHKTDAEERGFTYV